MLESMESICEVFYEIYSHSASKLCDGNLQVELLDVLLLHSKLNINHCTQYLLQSMDGCFNH